MKLWYDLLTERLGSRGNKTTKPSPKHTEIRDRKADIFLIYFRLMLIIGENLTNFAVEIKFWERNKQPTTSIGIFLTFFRWAAFFLCEFNLVFAPLSHCEPNDPSQIILNSLLPKTQHFGNRPKYPSMPQEPLVIFVTSPLYSSPLIVTPQNLTHANPPKYATQPK